MDEERSILLLRDSNNGQRLHESSSDTSVEYMREYMMQEDSCCIKIPSTACPQCQRWALGGDGPPAGAVARALLGHKQLLHAAAQRRGQSQGLPSGDAGAAAGDGHRADPLASLSSEAAPSELLHLHDAYLRLLRLHAEDVRRLAAAPALPDAPTPSLEDIRRRHHDAGAKDVLSDETGYNSGQSSPSSSTTLSPETSLSEVQNVVAQGDENSFELRLQTAEMEAGEMVAEADETLKAKDITYVVVEEEKEDEDTIRVEDGHDYTLKETMQYNRTFLDKITSQFTCSSPDGGNACSFGRNESGAKADEPSSNRAEMSDEQRQEEVQVILRSLDEALIAPDLEDEMENEEVGKAQADNNEKNIPDEQFEGNEHTIAEEKSVLSKIHQNIDSHSRSPPANFMLGQYEEMKIEEVCQPEIEEEQREMILLEKEDTKKSYLNHFQSNDECETVEDPGYQFSCSLYMPPRRMKHQQQRPAVTATEDEREPDPDPGPATRRPLLTLSVEAAPATGQQLRRRLTRLASAATDSSGHAEPPALQVEVVLPGGASLGPAFRLSRSDAASFYASLMEASRRGRSLCLSLPSSCAYSRISTPLLPWIQSEARDDDGGGKSLSSILTPLSASPPTQPLSASPTSSASSLQVTQHRPYRWWSVTGNDNPLTELWTLYHRLWSMVARLRARRQELRDIREEHAAATGAAAPAPLRDDGGHEDDDAPAKKGK